MFVCAKATYPLTMDMLRSSVMCSSPIRIARSFIGAYPSPIFWVGRFMASVGKLTISPIVFRAALLNRLFDVSR